MAWSHPYADRQDPRLRRPFAGIWEQAQVYCNFPVLRPSWIPADLGASEVWIRPEGGGGEGWSSVRAVLRGPGRGLRIKEFLWDWTLPYADSNLSGRPRDWRDLRGDLACFGVDYRGRPAACFGRLRTQVELSVEAGRFSLDELARLLDGLEPVDPDAVPALLAAPLHAISYSIRTRRAHWGMEDFAGLDWWSPAEAPDALRAAVGTWPPPDPLCGLTLESCGYRARGSGAWEAALVWRDARGGTDQMVLSVTLARGPGDVDHPPAGSRPGYWEALWVPLAGTRVGYARAGTHGNRRAAWRAGGRAWELWQRGSVRIDEAAFLAAVAAWVAAGGGGS